MRAHLEESAGMRPQVHPTAQPSLKSGLKCGLVSFDCVLFPSEYQEVFDV